MRNIIFGTLLAASTLVAIGGVSKANAMSAQTVPFQTGPAQQANPLVENVYWVRTYFYRPYVYLHTCGWMATVYGPAWVCN